MSKFKLFLNKYSLAYICILPWCISLVAFDIYPFIANLFLSFTNYSIGSIFNAKFIGFNNFFTIFNDKLFLKTIYNTFIYIVVSVPLSISLSFIIALLLNRKNKIHNVFRTIYYLPSLVPIVAASIVFIWILDYRFGVLNITLINLGLYPIRWLNSPDWTKISLVIVTLWGFGAQMIIFLAALQNIPNDLIESAKIDGANSFKRVLHITIPIISPTILFNLILAIIHNFQAFAIAYVLLGPHGGPRQSGMLIMQYAYNSAFSHFEMGKAAAISLVLFVIILFFTIISLLYSKKWVHYNE